MREIKFRAWDRGINNWLNETSYSLNGDGGILLYCEIGYGEKGWEEFDPNDVGIEIMQYTGLHDKNGKEIYEGDILSFKKPDIQLVEWCDKDAMFQLIPGRCGDPLYCSSSIIDFEQAEVIGNIHQHPDLIRKG